MSLGASFGAFAENFAAGRQTRRDNEQRDKANSMNERLLSIMENQQGAGVTSMPALGAIRSAPDSGTGGYGPPAPVSGTDDERTMLAKTIQAEAGGEGYDGMLAVGAVIGNRARSGKYGGSDLRGVIMAPGQFSAWNGVTGYAGGEGGQNMSRIKPSAAALRAADSIIAGGYSDLTGGATHYYNPAVATPKWGREAGGEWQTIGNHIFGFADGRPGAHPKQKVAELPDPTPPPRPAEKPAGKSIIDEYFASRQPVLGAIR